MKKKVLSFFLALVMVLCIVPMAAFAEGASTEPTEISGELSLPEESVEEKTGAAAVQALIDALPDAESIDESNMEDVTAQLEAIDEAKLQLSDDDATNIDYAHYDAAVAALQALMPGAENGEGAIATISEGGDGSEGGETSDTGDVPGEEKTYEYTADENSKTCTITAYNGTDTAVVVPKTLDGYTVTGISTAFMETGITSITIPDTVTALDDYAFDQCTDLTSITLPSTLTSIGERAFYGCTSLESIVIPDSVTSLGREVLGSCANLTNVKLSSGLSEIPEYAFMYCTSLTSIEIPENIKYIDMLAFYNCESLTDISLPSGLEDIGDNAFGGCSALSSITIPASVIYLGEQMFVDCTSLTSVQLPSGLSEIPYYMFNGCTSLKSIVIPDSVTAIRDCAFKGCTQLSNVTIPNGVTYIGEYAFSGCGNLTGITLPGELNQIARRAFEDCGLTSITLPDKLQIINDLAFKNCKFDSITIPDSVTVLSKDFVDRDVEIIHNNNEAVNNWLAKYRSKTYDYEIDDDHCIIYNYYGKDAVVEIPSQIENVPVTIIDSGAFRDCFFVTDVTIPNTVTTIGEEAFVNCSGLVNITIPDSVTVISQYAFDSCTSLKTITIPDSVTSLRDNTFQNCTSLESIKLPSTIKKIPDGLFEDCTSLISVEIPASVTKIEEDAFRGCTSLKSITIPEGVTKIREDAFNECTSLETVTLPSTLTYIDEYAFDKCTSLKSITIPEGISGISIATFRDCTSLESVTLPSTLEEIEWAAFLGCKSLTYIEIPEGATTIESEAFAESGLEIAVLPESLTSIADDAFEKDVTVYGVAGSYAESWCKKNGITFIAGKPTVTGIKLSKTKLSLATDASETITATVKPEGITGVTITWSSSNENVATVSDNGTITAVGKCGTAVITASAMGVTAQCTVTITKNGQPAAHEYNATEYKWAADHSTCTATRTCKNCGAVETANGTVTAESTELSCTTDAATIYTATFAATWATTQKDTVTSQTATGHSWGETTYTWAQDYSSCTATRTCSTCSTAETATDSTLQKTVVPNSCEVSDGYEEYTADDFDTDDKDWTVKQTTKIDTAETKEHTWGETTYTWSADFQTCTARRSCILNKDYSYEELTATVTEEGTAPTCSTGGKVLFTAKFAEGQTWAVTQKKEVPLPPTGHSWGETTYTWAADYSTCTATRTCANGCGKTETETVSATGTTTTEPTCTTAGVTTYSADFTKTWAEDKTKEVEIAALGHNFAAPTITWDSTGTKATAALLCGVCGHTESRDCTITSQVYNATCTEDKKTVYTASITVNGTTYTSENTVTEEGTAGHIWGTTIYEWAEDGSSCTAKRVCSRNSEHVETAQGIVSKIETKPVSCGEPGYIECAAKFREDWAKNKTITLPGETIEHSFGEYVSNKKATCTESGTLLATCGNCGATDEIEDPNAPALGHDYKETENKNGKITYTCSRCGASYTESAPSTETGSKTSVTSAGSQSDSVRTGDNSNLILWLALLLVSGGVAAATAVGRKRRRTK